MGQILIFLALILAIPVVIISDIRGKRKIKKTKEDADRIIKDLMEKM